MIMENQLDKKMDNGLESGMIKGVLEIVLKEHYDWDRVFQARSE